MEIKQYKEIKHLSGYIGIHSKICKNRQGDSFVNSDIIYSELARVSKAIYLNNDMIPCYQLIHLGGAFLSNEKYQTDIIVDNNAEIIVTSQSANKVNVTKPDDDPSTYNLNIEIKENASLEFINDAIILYPNAKYYQYSCINMTKTSNLIYTDIISPGYSTSEQKYKYDEMFLKLEITFDNKLVLYDKLYFEPKKIHPNELLSMNNFDRCGTMILINNKYNSSTILELHNEIKSNDLNFKYDLGISEFSPNCIGIRVLSNETFQIEKIFKIIHDYIRVKYLNKEILNLRKQP